MKLMRKMGVLVPVFGLPGSLMAAADTNVTGAITTLTDTWEAILVPIIAIGVFVIVWRLFKRGASLAR